MSKHPVSPNQLSFWSRFELLSGSQPEVSAWSAGELWQTFRAMLLVLCVMLWTVPTTRRARNHHGMVRRSAALQAVVRAGQPATSG
jgi:hypothetical protein